MLKPPPILIRHNGCNVHSLDGRVTVNEKGGRLCDANVCDDNFGDVSLLELPDFERSGGFAERFDESSEVCLDSVEDIFYALCVDFRTLASETATWLALMKRV